MENLNYALKEIKTIELYNKDLINVLKETIEKQASVFENYTHKKNEEYINFATKKTSTKTFFIKEDCELIEKQFNESNFICIGTSVKKEVKENKVLNNSIIRGFNKKVFSNTEDIFTFNKEDFGFETELKNYSELKKNTQELFNFRIKLIELLSENKTINYCEENKEIIIKELNEIKKRTNQLNEINKKLKVINEISTHLNKRLKESNLTEEEIILELKSND